MESGIERLLRELCTRLGFCLGADDRRRLRESPPADADGFADAVMAAEGMAQPYDKRLRAAVRDLVALHMSRWANDDRSRD